VVSGAATGLVSLLGADPASYAPHAVHTAGDRTYVETNCYADVLIELLHARGDEPLAVIGSTVRLDFEGDQWTFFKPDPGDLERLYGVDVHEMQPYRALPDQIASQLAAGRTMTIELDAWFLPDTAATSYRREHVKTTVIPEAIDRSGEVLRYFHNAGLYELSGEDYRGIFRLDGPPDAAVLPPYTELVRFDAGPRLAGEALRDGEPALCLGCAFATVRMVGSGFELLSTEVEWLFGAGGGTHPAAADAVAAMGEIVDGCKLLSLKLARRRAFDPAPVIDSLAAAWERATGGLDAALA